MFLNRSNYLYLSRTLRIHFRNITKSTEKSLKECYKVLQVPLNARQDEIREAFLKLAKKYHPDSGAPEASIDKFVVIENAFRTLTKHNTGASSSDEVEKIVYDIRHTAPQHRHYLSYEGVGHGTPSQRQKQWQQVKAQRAAENVLEHRLAQSLASENTLMKKGTYGKKHDIKTKYGFDRLVEDYIQEAMSKGEFENLSGKGKPLKTENRNPYVDFTTHKLNEVLINNGFTPEWITMCKDIDQEIESLKEELKKDRMRLGPYPLSPEDEIKWKRIYENNKDLARSINAKINTYNLIVPLLNKQKFHVAFEDMADEVLKTGQHSKDEVKIEDERKDEKISSSGDDLLSLIMKACAELFSFSYTKK